MKIEGVELGTPAPRLICFPRQDADGKDYSVPFMCGAVLNFDEFLEVLPRPLPFKKLMAGGKEEEDTGPSYDKALFEHATKKIEYMVIKSLESTEGLVWDKVKITEPDTWNLWEGEMKDAGFSEMEVQKLQLEVMRANAFDDETLEEAKENFLRLREEAKEA